MTSTVIRNGANVRVVVDPLTDLPAFLDARLDGIDAQLAAILALLAGGTPTPSPTLGTPSITSDGTPQVGEALTGVDGAVTNLGTNTLSRRWLLGSTVLATTANYTPVATGDHTFQNRIIAPDGTTVLLMASATVNVAAAPSAITPPVLAKTSSAGASPLLFSITLDNTVAAGMYWRLRRTNAQTGGNPNWADASAQTETRMITLDDFNGSPEFALLQGQPNGYNAFDLEVYDDSGRVSGRNGYVSDTITAAVSSTALTITNGTQKSQYAIVSGTPKLLLDAVDTGALNAVMANSSMVGYKHLEAVCLGMASEGNLLIGICDAAAEVGTTAGGSTVFGYRAGDSGKSGFSIDFRNFASGTPTYNVYVNGAQAAQAAFTLLTNDVIALEPNSTANTVKVIHRRGSTETVLGTWTLTSGIPTDWRNYVAATYAGDKWRMRYGATADPFTVTVSSGATFYG